MPQKKQAVKRYILFQVPEIAIILAILFIIKFFIDYPLWVACIVIGASVIKDVIMFRFTWQAYIPPDQNDHANLKEKICYAQSDFDTVGKVKLDGVLWNAQTKRSVKKGEKLIVEKVDGLKLHVKRAKTD